MEPSAEVLAKKLLATSFKEYHSIGNERRSVAKSLGQVATELTWVALEKVHGSNFSFVCDGSTLVCCRRNSPLDDAETFYGWQEVRDKYKENIFRLFEEIKSHFLGNVQQIVVYGELFGGIYPHAEVKDLGYQPIQKGIYYCPHIEFYAFDVQVTPITPIKKNVPEVPSDKRHPRSPNEELFFWMDYGLCMKLFQVHGFFYAKPVAQGTLLECFDYDKSQNSTLPALLGLPPLEKNQMEGVVIKALEDYYMPGKRARAIFKYKNARFAEVNPVVEETLYEKKVNAKKSALERSYTELNRYINENRLNSLESKIGPFLTTDQINKYSDLMAQDALKDFVIDNGEIWEMLGEEKQELVSKNATSMVRSFLTEFLQKNK